MSDDSDSNGGDNNKEGEAALGKEPVGNSKSTTDSKSKGLSSESNAGEEGGYGFIPPSAESSGGDSGGSSEGGSDGSDE